MRKADPSSRAAQSDTEVSTGDGLIERRKASGRLDRQQAIGAELRKAFESVAGEETPPRLKALAEKLDRELDLKRRD